MVITPQRHHAVDDQRDKAYLRQHNMVSSGLEGPLPWRFGEGIAFPALTTGSLHLSGNGLEEGAHSVAELNAYLPWNDAVKLSSGRLPHGPHHEVTLHFSI